MRFGVNGKYWSTPCESGTSRRPVDTLTFSASNSRNRVTSETLAPPYVLRQKNKHLSQRRNAGRGPVGKMAVVGVKDRAMRNVRAQVVPDTTGRTLRGCVTSNAQPEAMVYTDGETGYVGLPRQPEAVWHSVGEYVRGMAHTNGVESFWSMLKRAHTGTFHKLSPKHLDRYVQEFAGKHNVSDSDTLVQMRDTVSRIIGRNLLYNDLNADNGLDSGARH